MFWLCWSSTVRSAGNFFALVEHVMMCVLNIGPRLVYGIAITCRIRVKCPQ